MNIYNIAERKPLYRNLIPNKDSHPIVAWVKYAERVGYNLSDRVEKELEQEKAAARQRLAKELWEKRRRALRQINVRLRVCAEEIENHRTLISEEIKYHRKKASGVIARILEKQRHKFDQIMELKQAELARITEECAVFTWKKETNLHLTAYPNPPTLKYPIKEKKSEAFPEQSGIYFLWAGSTITYVGQSVNLRNRLTLSHHQAKIYHTVSWLLFEPHDLLFAESYYIGTLRPTLNRGTPPR